MVVRQYYVLMKNGRLIIYLTPTCFPLLGRVSMFVPLTTGAFSWVTPPLAVALPLPRAISAFEFLYYKKAHTITNWKYVHVSHYTPRINTQHYYVSTRISCNFRQVVPFIFVTLHSSPNSFTEWIIFLSLRNVWAWELRYDVRTRTVTLSQIRTPEDVLLILIKSNQTLRAIATSRNSGSKTLVSTAF